jgi:hypothetical protein
MIFNVFFLYFQILRFIYVSRCGLRESELMELVPNLSLNFLTLFTEILFHHLIIKYQGGLLMFAHQQVRWFGIVCLFDGI